MNILLVEDTESIIKGLTYSFKKDNHNLTVKTTIKDSKEYLLNNSNIDLIILDITLPDGNGFNLFENTIKDLKIPTIFLTAKDEEDDIVKGLNIGGTKERMFVVGKDLKKNVLYICIGEDNDYLITTSCIVDTINWLGEDKITKCCAKFRYRQPDIEVELEWLNNNEILVKYPQGVKAVTPGQACVFYKDDICLGGGIIKEVRKNNKKLWYL